MSGRHTHTFHDFEETVRKNGDLCRVIRYVFSRGGEGGFFFAILFSGITFDMLLASRNASEKLKQIYESRL